jgi:hypothetical protein
MHAGKAAVGCRSYRASRSLLIRGVHIDHRMKQPLTRPDEITIMKTHLILKTVISLLFLLVATALASGAAWAQGEEVPAEENGAAAAPTGAGSQGVPGGETAGSGPVDGSAWFRVDTDNLGTQFWFGATHSLGGFKLASDIYVVGTTAQLDIGPALTFGSLSLTPMIGFAFDFTASDLTTIVPQLYTIWSSDGPLYFESWIQIFLYSPVGDGIADLAYTRNFLLYKLDDWFAVGPNVELSFQISESVAGADDAGLVTLPVGPAVMVGYGKSNTLLLFLGYETQAAEGEGALTGRFTFIRYW